MLLHKSFYKKCPKNQVLAKHKKNNDISCLHYAEKQPSRSVLRKRSSGNMHQIYRRIPVPKCEFNKVALLSCTFAVYFQNTFSKNTSVQLLLIKIVKTGIWTTASDCQNRDLVKISDQEVTVRLKK